MFSRFIHWIFHSRRKMCRSCCLRCKYFEECREEEGKWQEKLK